MSGFTPRRGPNFEPHEDGLLEKAWRILRAQKWLVIQAIVLCGALAYLFSSSKEERYTASASILFRSASDRVLNDNAGFIDPTREAATNESLLGLGVVSERAAKLLGDRLTPAQIHASVAVVTDPNADIATVQATTASPALSAAVANAYGSAFIRFREDSAKAQIDEGISLARDAYAQIPRDERDTEDAQALRDRINELETLESLQTGGAELVQRASPPTAPSAPKPVRDGLLGAMLGAVLGFSLAAIRERWRGAIRDVDDLESISTLTALATIPRSRVLARGVQLPPRSEESEAFRILRANLRFAGVENELRSMLVTSARAGEGKSTVARYLAVTMAAMGDRVALVDADMHAGRNRGLGIEQESGGLADLLTGADLDDVLLEVPVDGASHEGRTLSVLPRGKQVDNPSELLESPRMQELMDELHSRYDLVIVDSPPLGLMSDAVTLVHLVSGVMVVSGLGKTTRDDMHDVTRRMSLMGGSGIGLVVNFAPSTDRGAGSYYSQRA